jgi:hypothetical protein
LQTADHVLQMDIFDAEVAEMGWHEAILAGRCVWPQDMQGVTEIFVSRGSEATELLTWELQTETS